jgi:hypothetical protein
VEFEEQTFDNFVDNEMNFRLKKTKSTEFEELMENEV